ncbi:MAG: ABC transporter permease subunit [Candidatus Eisenbacteria bacterium]|nr:ABC transporter permease subunit [Candidatus Eisenbacteria bacterium]
MRAHYIGWKDLRIRLRDRNTLVLMLLLPVALTAIIGFAFGGDSGISTVEFLVAGTEEDDLISQAAAGLGSGSEMFQAEPATESAAREAVAAGEKPAAVILPEDLTETVIEGRRAEVVVLSDPASRIKSGIVRELAERFVARLNAGSILSRGVFETLAEERGLSEAEQRRLGGFLFGWARDALEEPRLTVEQRQAERQEIDVRAYFAPSFAVMFLLFTMLTSAKTIHEEREAGTYSRLMTAPVARTTFVGGKLLGSYLLASIQILLLVLLSSLLFGIRWGSSPIAVVAMSLATAAGASSLALLIASLTRTSRQTDNVGTAFVLIMSLLGGSMWPIEQAPEGFRSAARFTFNYWAHSGFKELVFNDAGLAGIWQELVVILGMSAVAFVLAATLLVRR